MLLTNSVDKMKYLHYVGSDGPVYLKCTALCSMRHFLILKTNKKIWCIKIISYASIVMKLDTVFKKLIIKEGL